MISSHLAPKPWQVALSIDPKLLFRKWNHIGTIWAVSSISAAYQARKADGDIVQTLAGYEGGAIFKFPDGMFIHVH